MNKKMKKGIAAAAMSAMLSCAFFPVGTVLAAQPVKGWRQNNNLWYYYNSTGSKVTNDWVKSGEDWYYLGGTGAMEANNWVKDSTGLWYYLSASGAMAKKMWVKDLSGQYYYLGASGAMIANGWAKDSSGKWYYLGASGAMAANNWIKDASKCWYYLGSDGAMLANSWVEYKGNYYYLNAGGDMAYSTTTPDGYGVDANGARIATNTADLNDGNTHSGNYVITDLGTFGPAVSGKTTTINGNVTINYSKGLSSDTIALKNLIINGKLTVNFGSGSLFLDNVKVTQAQVSDVGSHSMYVGGNSSIGTLTVNDGNNDAHIVLDGNANITNTNVFSGVNLEVTSGAQNANPFGNVVISPVQAPSNNNMVTLTGGFTSVNVTRPSNVSVPEGSILQSIVANSNLNLSGKGKINKVEVAAPGQTLDLQAASIGAVVVDREAANAKVNVSTGTIISILNANALIAVTGTGTITTANLGVSGTTMETKPANVAVVSGVTATIAGQAVDSSNAQVITSVPTDSIPAMPVTPVIPSAPGYTPPSNINISGISPISGTAKVGSKLIAGTLMPQGAAATYQWQICDTADGTYTNIAGAVSNAYTLAAGDAGKYIKVAATGTGGYSGTVTSISTAQVANGDQAAPLGLAGVAETAITTNDGKITGTTTDMEYKGLTDSNWTKVTGTEIDGLVSGDYEVRYAAKTGYNAGAAATVTVAYSVTTLEDLKSALSDPAIKVISVNNDITVPSGDNITVPSTVTVIVETGYTLTVDGNLTLNGKIEGTSVIVPALKTASMNGFKTLLADLPKPKVSIGNTGKMDVKPGSALEFDKFSDIITPTQQSVLLYEGSNVYVGGKHYIGNNADGGLIQLSNYTAGSNNPVAGYFLNGDGRLLLVIFEKAEVLQTAEDQSLDIGILVKASGLNGENTQAGQLTIPDFNIIRGGAGGINIEANASLIAGGESIISASDANSVFNATGGDSDNRRGILFTRSTGDALAAFIHGDVVMNKPFNTTIIIPEYRPYIDFFGSDLNPTLDIKFNPIAGDFTGNYWGSSSVPVMGKYIFVDGLWKLDTSVPETTVINITTSSFNGNVTANGNEVNIKLDANDTRTVYITGNTPKVTIDASDANIVLNNAAVGILDIKDGAPHSVYVKNGSVDTLTVNDPGNDAHIVTIGEAAIGTADINSGAVIDSQSDSTNPVGTITINTSNENVDLTGNLATSDVNIENAGKVNVEATLNNVIISDAVSMVEIKDTSIINSLTVPATNADVISVVDANGDAANIDEILKVVGTIVDNGNTAFASMSEADHDAALSARDALKATFMGEIEANLGTDTEGPEYDIRNAATLATLLSHTQDFLGLNQLTSLPNDVQLRYAASFRSLVRTYSKLQPLTYDDVQRIIISTYSVIRPILETNKFMGHQSILEVDMPNNNTDTDVTDSLIQFTSPLSSLSTYTIDSVLDTIWFNPDTQKIEGTSNQYVYVKDGRLFVKQTANSEDVRTNIMLNLIYMQDSSSTNLNILLHFPLQALAKINAGNATVQDYNAAGITNVSNNNLAGVNSAVAAARTSKNADLTKDEIQAVAQTVPDIDTTAPILSNGRVEDLGTAAGTTATLKFDATQEEGTIKCYYLVQDSSISAPDVNTIKASNTWLTTTGNAPYYQININNMTAEGNYNAYIVMEDASGNTSDILTISEIKPYSNANLAKLGTPSVTLTPNISGMGGLLYTIVPADGPNDNDVKEYSMEIALSSSPDVTIFTSTISKSNLSGILPLSSNIVSGNSYVARVRAIVTDGNSTYQSSDFSGNTAAVTAQ